MLRGRLVSSCSCLPSNPQVHVLSYHSSTVPPGGHFKSCSVAFNFSSKMPVHKLRCWSTTRMRRLQYCRSQLFLYAVFKVSPDWSRRGTTRCNPVLQHTRFMAGRVCFSLVFKKNRSSPTTPLNTKYFGERLTIVPAGRFCASHAPLSFLWDLYLLRVRELWLEQSRKSTIHQPGVHCDGDCRATQDKYTRLLLDLVKKLLCFLIHCCGQHTQQHVCTSNDLENGSMEDL